MNKLPVPVVTDVLQNIADKRIKQYGAAQEAVDENFASKIIPKIGEILSGGSPKPSEKVTRKQMKKGIQI